MKSFEYIDNLIEMEYKPMCSVCHKELNFKGTVFYQGKAYCMDCRRKLKQKDYNKLFGQVKESQSDDYRYRELVVNIHEVEEEIKNLEAKKINPNSKVIVARRKPMTIFQYNTLKKKEQLESLKYKLKNLNDEYDKLIVQNKLKETL